jgi:type IV pilus assembly protein PilV
MANQKGFSLIEVLVAVTLLAIGLLGVAGMQSTAISGNAFAQTGTLAINLAEEMVDRIRTNAGTDPVAYNAIDTSGSVSSLQASLTGAAQADALQWKTRLENSLLQNASGRVTVISDSPLTNSATISVEVRWGPSGNNRNIIISTILETWGT